MSPIFRELVVELMAGHVDIEVVEDLDTRDELEQRLQALVPDLVLIGLNRDEGDEIGLSLLRLLPNARVIAFSSDGRNAFVYRAYPGRTALLDVSPQLLLDAMVGQSTQISSSRGFRSSLNPILDPKEDSAAHSSWDTPLLFEATPSERRPQGGSYRRSRDSLGGIKMSNGVEMELTPEDLEALTVEDAEMEEVAEEVETEEAENFEDVEAGEGTEGQEAFPLAIAGKFGAKYLLKLLAKLFLKKLLPRILGNSRLKAKWVNAAKSGGRPAVCRLLCQALCKNVPKFIRPICNRLCPIVCRKVYPILSRKLGIAS